ncbi:MAG: amidohydrolase [Clostridiales Family XIII bacterium]|jgi:aminobenzoyl-glutamate utilization protein B|nr:amidohydrolase [Clostridiales Family XIII bacterium]
MDVERIKKDALRWARDNGEEFYGISKEIWENPELSMQELKSCELLKGALRARGFRVEEGVAGMPTAFVAAYGDGFPVIAVNCEYDALPGLSQSAGATEKRAVREGAPGQGCGHNLLGTAAVKAAAAMRFAMEKHGLGGTVKVIGAPAEELCLGKPFLGKAGLLEGMDAFLDWHPWSYNRADFDSCCAYFSVKYHYRGRTCHGNSPWHGRSALDAAMLQAHATECLREHLHPGEPPDAANTLNYTFSSVGPEFPSVVPDRATIWYVGRFVTSLDAEDALRRVTNCAKGAALATDTEVDVEIITATNHKIPNKVLANLMHKNFVALGAPEFTPEEQAAARAIQRELGVPESGLATEILPFGGGFSVVCDTSEYSWNAPYATAWIAMAPENAGWHHWGVTSCAAGSMGQKSMDKAAELLAVTGIDLLCDASLVEDAKAELRERLAGKAYKCLLPADLSPPADMNAGTMEKYKKGR